MRICRIAMSNTFYRRSRPAPVEFSLSGLKLPTVDRLFAERYRLNGDGFLDVDRSPELFRAEHLFADPVALIIAPPWMGKTYVAKRIEGDLRRLPKPNGFGPNLSLTELGLHGAERSLPPAWWQDWRMARPARPACWLVDALDEGEARLGGVSERILREVEALDGEHRAQLRLIIFTRQRDWLARFRVQLGEAYELGPFGAHPEFMLAPVHATAARAIIRSDAAFDRVTRLIRQFDLQPVAGYPVVLQYLRDRSETGDLSVVTIWRDILSHLLDEPDRTRGRLQSEPEDRFEAAARIAAVLALTRGEQVSDRSGGGSIPTIPDLFPYGETTLRCAAREVCDIGPFVSTAEDGYRFAQQNVRDWFAAFGLSRLRQGSLRSVLCDETGRVWPRHRELLPLLARISTDPDVRNWACGIDSGFPSDLIGVSLQESLTVLDRIEAMATSAPSSIRLFNTELNRLTVPGLGEELARRLSDPERPSGAREVVIDVALATDPIPCLEPAVRIVSDPNLSPNLRTRALLLLQMHGGIAHFRELAEPIGRSAGSSRAEARLRASVIRALVEQGHWSIVEAALHAPPAEHDCVDDRCTLLRLLHDKMTAHDARHFLRDAARYRPVLSRLVVSLMHESLWDKTQSCLLAAEHLDDSDATLLTDMVIGEPERDQRIQLGFNLTDRLLERPFVRRRLYEFGVQEHVAQPDLREWSYVLTSEDLEWLSQRAQVEWSAVRMVWEEVYLLTDRADRQGLITRERREQLWAALDTRFPELRQERERGAQAAEKAFIEHQRRMEERRREYPTCILSEVIEGLLADEALAPPERMRQLTYACFIPQVFGTRIEGDWDGRPGPLRARVRTAFRLGLETGEPTPIPDGHQYPAEIDAESRAFREVVSDPEHTNWVTPELVRRWLPAACHAFVQETLDVIRRCSVVDLGLTREVLLLAAERELRNGSRGAVRAGEIPTEWWDDATAARITLWAEDEAYHPEGRAHLLELLVMRNRQEARPIADKWARLVSREGDETLRRVGLNVLLVLDPPDAWPLVEADYAARGAVALRDLSVLYSPHCPLRISFDGLPAAILAVLGQMMATSFPLVSDPDTEHRIQTVTAESELRRVRDDVIYRLFANGVRDGWDAMWGLAAVDSALAERMRGYEARAEAQVVLGGLPPVTGEGSEVSVDEAVRILNSPEYRLIRSEDDLLAAILEVLTVVEHEVPADLALLYGPPARGRERESRKERRHLEEDALQAYVRRRLLDLLPHRVRTPRVSAAPIEALREDQGRYRRRVDLRVLAPTADGTRLATVIIEVKWSDNPETAGGLVDQLGRKYLLGEQKTHGIYLVGWTGEWARAESGRDVDRANLEDFLRKQRDQFVQSEGIELTIETVVVGLTWREPELKGNPSSDH
jgi:hypothetical protein